MMFIDVMKMMIKNINKFVFNYLNKNNYNCYKKIKKMN